MKQEFYAKTENKSNFQWNFLYSYSVSEQAKNSVLVRTNTFSLNNQKKSKSELICISVYVC